jgi:type II secretory pathway component PulF
MLSVTTASGRPLAGALSTLAKYHSNPWIRHRLLLARNEIEQGADPWQGLREAELITPDQEAALSRVHGNASQAWVLRQVAHHLEDRVCESQHRLGLWGHPILAVAFGCVVGWLAFGMFRSLYGLVQSLS